MKSAVLGLLMALSSLTQAQTWLMFPAATGYVNIGDLDVPGNQLTVEALYTSTNPASVDLVSKHASPADVNYLLRQTHAELSTTSGFLSTPGVCPPDQNTCRHAAMVYDGVNLRFYLNGQLNGQVPFSGNMITNNHAALIGNYGCCFGGEQFFGYIDEVRIWNVARTQAQVQANMFSSLPSPTTQPGLLAYYSLSSTLNLQGNPTFDGFLAGTGSLGNANPFCATLSPVCAILNPGFERFTLGLAGNGLQFDWEWAGDAPRHFELENSLNSTDFRLLAQVGAAENSYAVPLPAAACWYRVRAMGMNGEVKVSNAVEYRPDSEGAGLQLQQKGNRVLVRLPKPMDLQWRVMDLAGRELAAGHTDHSPGFEIALPEAAQGMLLVAVWGEGQRRVLRVWR